MKTQELALEALGATSAAKIVTPEHHFVLFNWITNPPRCKCDKVGKNEYCVDRAGYIPAKQQIQNLIAAGENLELYRARMYTNTPENADIEPLDLRHMDEMDINDCLKKTVKRIQLSNERRRKMEEKQDDVLNANKKDNPVHSEKDSQGVDKKIQEEVKS